jgi:hypothetical protein
MMGGQRYAPNILPPEKRRDCYCTGGWVDANTSLEGCGKSRLHRDLILVPSSRSMSLYRLLLHTLYLTELVLRLRKWFLVTKFSLLLKTL